MTTPIQIRKADVVRDIRNLAAQRGQSITDVVGDVVRTELERPVRQKDAAAKLAAVRRLVEEYKALPKTGATLTDDDLYDEYGLPK